MKLSKWIMDDYCSMRILEGSDPENVANRYAYIEKTPRIRIQAYDYSKHWLDDWVNWLQGPKGHAPEYGKYQPSRDWCDAELLKRGYELG